MNIIQSFKESFKELKKVRTIVICGFLLALSLVLNNFGIRIPNVGAIGFSVIPKSIAGMLFGPVATGILGGCSDVIGHFISPQGSFFFGYTFNAILSGVIYGIFFYRKSFDINNKKQLLIRLVLAKLLVSIFINLLLGTYWYTFFVSKGFLALLPARIIKELVGTAIHIAIVFYILPIINKLYRLIFLEWKYDFWNKNKG